MHAGARVSGCHRLFMSWHLQTRQSAQDYPSRDALAAAMKLRMQQQSAPKKTSRLKRIILTERAEKAVAEATVNLQAAAQMTVAKMDHMRGLAEQLQVTTTTGPQHGCANSAPHT